MNKGKFCVITLLFSILSLFSASPAMAGDAWVGVYNFQSKMAKQGSASAQFKLGEMHEQGLGTGQDLNKAMEWYRRAAEQDYQPAIQRLKAIEVEKQQAEQARREQQRQARLEQERQAQEQARKEREQRERQEAQRRQAEADKAASAEAESKRSAEELAAARQRAREAAKKMLEGPDAYGEDL